MKLPIRITSILPFLFIATLLGQEPTPIPPPTAPWVADVPKNSTFTIAITYSDEIQSVDAEGKPVPSKSDRPVKVQVWRDANSRHIVVTHANGIASEGFLFESGFIIRSTANSDKTFVSSSATGRDASLEIFSKVFQGTQWLEQKFYRGTTKLPGGEVYLYEQPPGTPPAPDTGENGPPVGFRPLDYMQLNAAIRVDNKLPVTVRLGATLYTFSRPEPWNGTVAMPDNFQSSAESFKRELGILEALKQKKK